MRWRDTRLFLGPLYQPPGAATAAGAVAVRMGFEKLGLQGRNKLQVAKTLGNLYLHPSSHLPSPHAALADGTGIGIR